MRRKLLVIGALAMLAGACGSSGAYPARPVRLVVPFPPGGAVDIIGRTMADALASTLGQSFVVENKPGAGGLLALRTVAEAPPDGYTLAVGANGPLTMSPSLFPDMGFRSLEELTPIVWFATTPGVLLVRKDLAAATVGELVDLSRRTPEPLTMASAGNGSIVHLMGEYFQTLGGVKWTHVPYRGSSAALVDLVAGRVDLIFDVVPAAAPHVRSGGARALAVTTAERSRLLPEVPTMQEAGYTEFDVSWWISLLGPRGLPPALAERLNRALNEALATPGVQRRLDEIGAQSVGGSADRLRARIEEEAARWSGIITQGRIKPD